MASTHHVLAPGQGQKSNGEAQDAGSGNGRAWTQYHLAVQPPKPHPCPKPCTFFPREE